MLYLSHNPTCIGLKLLLFGKVELRNMVRQIHAKSVQICSTMQQCPVSVAPRYSKKMRVAQGKAKPRKHAGPEQASLQDSGELEAAMAAPVEPVMDDEVPPPTRMDESLNDPLMVPISDEEVACPSPSRSIISVASAASAGEYTVEAALAEIDDETPGAYRGRSVLTRLCGVIMYRCMQYVCVSINK